MIPPRVAVAGIALLLACLIGAAGGMWSTARHFEPQLAEKDQALGEFRNAYNVLAEASGRQNTAIEAMRLEAERRKREAVAAAENAKRTADDYYRRAAGILGLKPPAGVDPCHAAREAFDAELREERGK